MDLEEGKELVVQMKNCVIAPQTGRRSRKLNQINADPKRSWHRLTRKQINQKLCRDQNVKLRLDKEKTTVVYWNRS